VHFPYGVYILDFILVEDWDTSIKVYDVCMFGARLVCTVHLPLLPCEESGKAPWEDKGKYTSMEDEFEKEIRIIDF
jgi:hypothetical protein